MTLACALKNWLAALDTTLLGSGLRDLPHYYGMRPVQARLFVGRCTRVVESAREVHGEWKCRHHWLDGQAAAQIRGIGGNGNSLLAREDSIRFGPAYPGGVYWLNAYGHDETKTSLKPEQRNALRHDQIREFAG